MPESGYGQVMVGCRSLALHIGPAPATTPRRTPAPEVLSYLLQGPIGRLELEM